MSDEIFEGELTEGQKFEMLHVTFPDGRWSTYLHQTPEIEAAFRRWLATDCDHDDEPGIRWKTIKGGGVQFVRVCLDCGYQFGGPVAKKDVPNPDDTPALGDLSADRFFRSRREDWRDQKLVFWEGQDVKVSKEYAAYLKSPEWRAKSKLVILRAQGICEGCRERPATQAHHLTYEHRFNEFLWELVAICDDCHTRIHPEKH